MKNLEKSNLRLTPKAIHPQDSTAMANQPKTSARSLIKFAFRTCKTTEISAKVMQGITLMSAPSKIYKIVANRPLTAVDKVLRTRMDIQYVHTNVAYNGKASRV